jgi:hypothetical protein
MGKATRDPPDSPGNSIDRLPPDATEPEETRKTGQAPASDDLPPAGPHAQPDLVNEDATPGAGTLTPPGEHDDVDSTSG